MMKLVSPRLCHSVSPSRVGLLMRCGFTQRQAQFVAHVLVFSGVFLERQYRTFTGLAHGQKTQDFLTKLVKDGYATAITPGALHRGRLFTSTTNRSTRPSASRIIAIGRPPRSAASSSD